MTKGPTKNSKHSTKKILIVTLILFAIFVILGFIAHKILNHDNIPLVVESKTTLDAEYKNTDGTQIEIAKQVEDEKVPAFLEGLISKKKSFAIYVSLPICNGDAAKFKEYVMEYQRKNHVSFYYLTSDYVKDTSIYDTVKFFPSVIIYREGKIINYLKYDSDKDFPFYKSYDGFTKWIKANVE